MKNRFEIMSNLIGSVKDKGIQYALIAIFGAMVAKDIYVELFIEPQLKEIEFQKTIELEKENERLRTLLSTQSIGLDYAINGDIETAMIYKMADVSNQTELNDYLAGNIDTK
ncbi:hypothetical protein EX461_24465 [Vibrio parahaemolyticus]|nr:hypothetical protein [Vibrio parahaemolyticus]